MADRTQWLKYGGTKISSILDSPNASSPVSMAERAEKKGMTSRSHRRLSSEIKGLRRAALRYPG